MYPLYRPKLFLQSFQDPMNAQSTPARSLLLALTTHLLAALSFCIPSIASGQEYPVKPVKIIVPFAPGGPADIYARAIAQRLQEALKQSFIVENRVGGGAVIGTDAAAKSAADGYTLLMMSNTQTVNESLIPNKPYQLMRDFVPVAPINSSDLLLVVNPALPANNLKELIALVKAKPGKYNYASSGPGTPYHMAGELFKVMSGTYIVHVPYRGSSGARTDVIGGQVEMMFDAVPTMIEQVKSGRVRAIATTGLNRSSVLPDVPTVSESGVKGYDATIWLGIMAPKGTPSAIVEKLNVEINKITSRADIKAAWGKSGASSINMNTTEFQKYLQDDIAKWERIVKISGAKADQ
jgi:tripartite-type tricarboxylate transporter receptor subunit TctC